MDFEVENSKIIILLLIVITAFAGYIFFKNLNLSLRKKKAEKEMKEMETPLYEQAQGAKLVKPKEDPAQKFFLRRINDFWIPLIVTGAYIVLNIFVLGVQALISFQSAAGLMAIAFKITTVSWAIPIVKLLLKIYFPILDHYTDAEKLDDFDNATDRKTRLWIYVILVSVFSYIVVA